MNQELAVFALIFTILMFIVLAAISIAVGSGVYMLACFVFNILAEHLTSKSGTHPTTAHSGWSPNQPPVASGNPYAAPHTPAKSYVRRTTKYNVPIPSFLNALLIIFSSALASAVLWGGLFVVLIALSIVIQIPVVAAIGMILAILAQIVGTFCITSAIGSKCLPTSFGRSALVTLLFYLMYLFVSLFLSMVFGTFAAILG